MNIDPSGYFTLFGMQAAQSISSTIDGVVNSYNKMILKAAAIIFSTVSVGKMYMYGNTAADYFGGGNTENILSGLGNGSIGSCEVGMLAEASIVGALAGGMGITNAALSAISTVQMNNPQSEFYRGLVIIAVFNSLTLVENPYIHQSKKTNPGKDFDPDGKDVQEGVNPETLTPGKDLSTLDKKRQKNAVEKGGDKPIIVDRKGRVLDGNHRLKDAIEHRRAVDVSIGY